MGSAQPQPTRSYGPFTGGNSAVGTQVDTDLNTLYTVLQGGVGDTHIATNAAIQQAKLQTTQLGYAAITATQNVSATSETQVTSLTATVTIPSGSRNLRITAYSSNIQGNSVTATVSVWDGVVGSGTKLEEAVFGVGTNFTIACNLQVIVEAPAAGSKTYNVGMKVNTGNANFTAAATTPGFLLVELI